MMGLTADRFSRLKPLLPMLFLGACGIDQGGAPVGPSGTAPPQAVVVTGPITGFGSVLVNDLTLDTSGADIRIDDEPAIEGDLKVGQVIRAVVSSEAMGDEAVLIEYRENVRGPVMAVDAAGGTLTILGQQVTTSALTVFDLSSGTDVADIPIGAVIEVSGIPESGGAISATYVGDAPAGSSFEVTTLVAAVNAAAQTFQLAGLAVDFSQAMLVDLVSGLPEIGIVVEVEGTSLDGAGQLVADVVRLLPAEPGSFSAVDTDVSGPGVSLVGAPESSPLQINAVGFITDADLPDSIQINDVEISLPNGIIVNGGQVSDLQVGTLVRVTGAVTSLGLVEAQEVTIL